MKIVRERLKRWVRPIVAIWLGLTSAVVVAVPAQAAAFYPCSYPYVCLYTTNPDAWAERYQVVTSGFQPFSRRDITEVRNMRNDDVAFIRYTNGTVRCVPAGEGNVWVFQADTGGTPNGIRIDSSASCGSTPQVYTSWLL